MTYTIKKDYNPEIHNTSLPIRTFLDKQREKGNAELVHISRNAETWIYHYKGSTITFYETMDPEPHGPLFFRLHLQISSNTLRKTKKILIKLENMTLN